STVAPVAMILAMVTSSAWPTALVTSSRAIRLMAWHVLKHGQSLPAIAGGQRSWRLGALAVRGQPRRILRHDPEFDRCQHRHGETDDYVHGHRGGSLETQNPGRDQRPQSDDQVQPFLPDRERGKRSDRNDCNDQTGDIGVFRDLSGIEPEHP